MKKYEKTLLTLLAVLIFATLVFPSSIYLFVPSFFTIWLLGLSYFLGGHSLFYIAKEKEAYLPLFAGLSYGPAVITLSLSTSLQQPDYFVYFPIPAILLTIGLVIYILLKRKKGGIDKEIRMIFYRGLVISLITSFFLYTPETFKPYRKVLMTLNSGDSSLAGNIAMMDAIMESETAASKGDCDKAIQYALKANSIGKKLLDYKEQEEDDSYQMRALVLQELNDNTIEELNLETLQLFRDYKGDEHLYPISRTYSTLFNAYYCKGEKQYTEKQYTKALSHYLTAFNYITTTPIKSVYWQEQKSDILNMIGHCYRQLNKIELSAYFFMSALKNYNEATNNTDIDLTSSAYVSNVAFLMSSQNGFAESNELLESINVALLKEEQTQEHRKVLLNNYQAQSYNYLALDNLEQAFASIEKAQKLVDPHSSNYCTVQYIVAYCQFKANQFKEAETTVKDCLRCFEETSTSSSLKSMEGQTLLGQIKFALGQFDEAKAQITVVLDLTAKSAGKNNDLYAYNSKILGDIDKILGNYSIAKQNYTTALELYNSGKVTQTHNIPLVLTGLADLALLQANFIEAQFLIDQALDDAALTLIPSSPNMAHIYSQAAHIAYHRNNLITADTLYQKSIAIAEHYNLDQSLLNANTRNGLGLVEMNRNNYVEANKHFQEALKLYQKIVSNQNPFTAQVYLNYGILHLRAGQLAEAKEKITQAWTINQAFFKADHPIFGDIAVAMGDLAVKQGEGSQAQNQYQKALTIYNKYFDSTHWKVRETQQKLK